MWAGLGHAYRDWPGYWGTTGRVLSVMLLPQFSWKMYFPVMEHHVLTRVGTQMTNLRTPDAPPIVIRSRESREKDLMKRFDRIIPFIKYPFSQT